MEANKNLLRIMTQLRNAAEGLATVAHRAMNEIEQSLRTVAPVEQPREHWCGRNVDHSEHVHARDSEAMYCLGSHEGVYGAKP